MTALASAPRMESTLTQFFRPRVKGRMARSAVIFPVFIFGFIAKPVQVEQLGDQLHTLCGNGSFEFRNAGGFYEFRILNILVR